MSTAKKLYETASQIDSDQRNHLLMEQLPQVRYIAKRIHDRLPQHVALEDLVHAGVIGLIDALHKYDPSKNVQLKSYAKFRIRGAILDSLRELDWSPRDLRKKARRLEQADRKLKDQLGRAATEPELAAEMGLVLDEFQRLLGELRGLDLGSLQAETSEGVDNVQYCAYQPNGPAEDPFFLCLRSEMKDLLGRAIDELPQKEREALALYYFEELTMKEVGAVLGVSESRVSQIHSTALIRVRARMKELMESRPAPNLTGQNLPEPVAGIPQKRN
ncbi:MAG: FliA/WhiG family RNA polymerase sigma factor [Acidobacteria bacterium]|nr:FliA/WhiG family RNA polymerase sigma factor [Acidobacteriota bacterium]